MSETQESRTGFFTTIIISSRAMDDVLRWFRENDKDFRVEVPCVRMTCKTTKPGCKLVLDKKGVKIAVDDRHADRLSSADRYEYEESSDSAPCLWVYGSLSNYAIRGGLI